MVKLLLTYYLWLEKPWFPRPFCNIRPSGCGTRNTWYWPDVHWFSWRQKDHPNQRRTISGIRESIGWLNRERKRSLRVADFWKHEKGGFYFQASKLHSLESYVSTVYFPRGFLESYKTRSPSKVYIWGSSSTPLNWHILYKWIHRKAAQVLCNPTRTELLSKAWKIVGIGKPFSGFSSAIAIHISMLIFSPQVATRRATQWMGMGDYTSSLA